MDTTDAPGDLETGQPLTWVATGILIGMSSSQEAGQCQPGTHGKTLGQLSQFGAWATLPGQPWENFYNNLAAWRLGNHTLAGIGIPAKAP